MFDPDTDERSNSQDPEGIRSINSEDLRFLFVQFLFGLAAAEVAIQASDLFLKSNLIGTDAFWIQLVHLVFTLILISTSWVGWSNSSSSKNTGRVQSVFSRVFLVLILDVFLVALYYMLARSSGLTGQDQRDQQELFLTVYWPTVIMVAIFAVYLVWDLVTKWPWGQGECKRIKVTALGLVMAGIVCLFLRDVNTVPKILLTYLALILIDLSFRGFKDPRAGGWKKCVSFAMGAGALASILIAICLC